MFKPKIYLFVFLLLATLLTAKAGWAAETKPLNAGFVNTLWYSSNDFIVGEKVRIYSAIQNQSPFDLVGEVKLFDNDKEIQKNSLAIAEGTLVHNWFDLTITTGTHKIYEVFTNTKISKVESGTEAVTVRSQTSTIEQKNSSPKTTPPPIENNNSTSTTTKSNTEIITVSSDAQAITKNGSSPSIPSTSTTKTILNKTTAETKNFISGLTGGLVETLKKQKNLLDEDIKNKNNHEPVPLLADAAEKMEQKATFLKIPRDKIPSFATIQSWSLAAGIYILQTWWIMVLIFLLILRGLWKLWGFIRKREY